MEAEESEEARQLFWRRSRAVWPHVPDDAELTGWDAKVVQTRGDLVRELQRLVALPGVCPEVVDMGQAWELGLVGEDERAVVGDVVVAWRYE